MVPVNKGNRKKEYPSTQERKRNNQETNQRLPGENLELILKQT